MKFLFDQGLPRAAARLLQQRGIDATHVQDCNLAAAEDDEILRCALGQQRAVINLDADFHVRLALSGDSEPSVIRIRIEGLKADAVAQLMERVIPVITAEVAAGRQVAVSVSETAVRYRHLPLG